MHREYDGILTAGSTRETVPAQTPKHGYERVHPVGKFLEDVQKESELLPCKLHTTVGTHIRWTDKVQTANETLTANYRNFRRQANGGHGKNGGQTRRKKERV